MKRILIVALMLFVCVPAFATTSPTYFSSNTVSFNSVDIERNRNVQIVTFNSVTKHIMLRNMSPVVDAYCDIKCVDSAGKRGYANSTASIMLFALGSATPNTVEIDFATFNLGFRAVSDSAVRIIPEDNKRVMRINYYVTSDVSQP